MRYLIGIGLACSVTAGCATSQRGTQDWFYVISEPQGAHVETSIGETCIAPCTMVLPRRSEFDVTVSLEGCESWTGQVAHVGRGEVVVAVVSAGNVIGGAALGYSVGVTAVLATGQAAAALGGSTAAAGASLGVLGAGILFGASVPFAVDASSGANRNLSPNPLIVLLGPTDDVLEGDAAPGGPCAPSMLER